MFVDATHNELVLHAMGANFTEEVRDDEGHLTGYNVRPDIDLSGYAAAAAAMATLPTQTVFQPRDFVNLFTPAEQTALFTARRTVVQVDQFITLAMAGPVDITNAEVIADINAVAAAEIITPDRAAQILAGTPAPTG